MWNQGRPYGDGRRGGYRDLNDDSDHDDVSANSAASPSSQQPEPQQANYVGGYTVITPDERKRRQLLAQAERERQQYEQHRKQNKPQNLSYVGAVGGTDRTLAEARQDQVRTHAQHNKTSRLLKEQERKAKQREAEDRELDEKKAAARRQAERNAQRQMERQEQWRYDMKRTNQAFLDKLEAQSKAATTSTQPPPPFPSQSTGRHHTPPSSTFSNPAGRQRDSLQTSYTPGRNKAPSGQKTPGKGSPLATGNKAKPSTPAGPQLFRSSYVPPARKEVSSSIHAGHQTKTTGGTATMKSGTLSSNSAVPLKKSLEGSEPAKEREGRSSEYAEEYSVLQRFSVRSSTASPTHPPRAESFNFASSRSGSSMSPNDAGEHTDRASSFLGRASDARASESSYMGGSSSRSSLSARGTSVGSSVGGSSSKSSYFDEGTFRGCYAGGAGAGSSRAGRGSFLDTAGSERSYGEMTTSGGLFGGGYGIHDSRPREHISFGMYVSRRVVQDSNNGGRTFDGISSGRLRSDALYAQDDRLVSEAMPMEQDLSEEEEGKVTGEEEEEFSGEEEQEDDPPAEDYMPPASAGVQSDDFWQNLEILHRRFPHCDQSMLWDVLRQCNGSLGLALQLLGL